MKIKAELKMNWLKSDFYFDFSSSMQFNARKKSRSKITSKCFTFKEFDVN